ncbi:hypothetical protein BH23GEM9_BH23GEM9_34290 [soil metagenome]
MRNAVLPLIFCVLFGACYSRQPLESAAPAPSTRIVATLTDEGTVAMGNSLGPGASEIEGVVSTATDTIWTLHMVRVMHHDGRSVPWSRESVSIPRNVMRNPTVVVLDKRRSWMVAGAAVAGTILLARAFNVFGFIEDDRGGELPPPAESIIPAGRR